MSATLMGCCGLVCSDCPAYIAKTTDDDALRAKTASEWSGPDGPASIEEINCDGCTTPGGVRYKHCEVCKTRLCATSRGFAMCAECQEYACDELKAQASAVGVTLDAS
ncbi:DUF3795 domain-containing protein [Candidatus Bipolaricaulota bacterium]